MTELSIIIVNWKSAEYLRACLASIYHYTKGTRFEIIVVDNASNDGCETMLRREFPEVILITSPENLGFARANNLGFTSSSGETLLFINPDTEIFSDVLSPMVVWMRTHPLAGAVGTRLLNSDGSLQSSCVQAFPTILNQVLDSNLLRSRFPTWRLWGTQALYDLQAEAAEVDAISGACFMVRRSAFEAAGRFTESYFMYSDDLDLSYKIHRAGYTVACLPRYDVVHHGGKSSDNQSGHFAEVLQRESMVQFLRSTRGRLYSTTYRCATSLASLLRLGVALWLLLFPSRADRRQAAITVAGKWFAVFAWSVGLGSLLHITRGETNA
jgi:GT2 family glycosyltransferase